MLAASFPGQSEEYVMALSQHAYARLVRQVRTPTPASAPWVAPSLSELVARIDAALATRRAA